MQTKARHDFETRSACNLPQSGVYRYAEHPSTEVLCMAWSMGDGLVYTWRPGDPPPGAFLDHVARGGMVGVHNAGFERRIWRMLRDKYPECQQWPELKIQQQDCTMSRAAALGLPQDLDTLSTVVNAGQLKDTHGHALMMKMSKPRKIEPDGRIVWWEDPKDMEYLCYTYCPQDVRAESAVDDKLLPLSPHERRIWELDQTINDRGVYVDELAITRAVDVVLLAKKRADQRMAKLTGGAVKKCTEIAKLVTWIQEQGIPIESAKKGQHDEIMALADLSDMPQVRKAIELRKEASKTSTAKYSKMLNCICADGRIRGLLAYHGALTGRWAGRLVQPQNFPRVDYETEGAMVEYVAALLTAAMTLDDIHDMIELGGYEVLPALSKTLRGMICAA